MNEQSPRLPSPVVELIEGSGDPTDAVPVTVGPRFLELFSENLYGSPNKAFEELVANSWDADAQSIFIHIPEDLDDPAASIWVLDNGSSMDLEGLQRLWAVAQSNKRDTMKTTRPQIGKFGIGKLATYILANEITYICKGLDGTIRAVTMDYRRVEEGDATALHQQAISLDVRQINTDTLKSIARGFSGGDYFLTLVNDNLPMPQSAEVFADDFGGLKAEGPPSTSNTWTLALLSSLKDEGRSIQRGRVRWMLRTALPLNASVGIALNKETLLPSKVNKPIEHEWVLGDGIGLSAIDIGDTSTASVTEEKAPSPSLFVEGIEGPITGRFRLYSDRISGGKSDALGASNGFFVNVKGRVINYSTPDFGLDNLSHGPWSQFRATIRCDGLDGLLNVDRNGLREGPELDTFQSLLRTFFNKARQKHTSLESANWPSAGDILTGSWNVIPLQSLGTVVAERLQSGTSLPSVFDAADVADFEATLSEWEELRTERQGDLIADVAHEDMDPKHPVVRYDLANHRFLINSAHPFVRQHSATHEEQLLIREMLLVTFLSDARLLDLGLNDGIYEDVGRYRDELLRLMSQLNRKTGPEIADLLLRSTTNSGALESAAAEALRYLGFDVVELGGKGEPDGIVRAPLFSAQTDSPPSYSFVYDTKSKPSSADPTISNRVSNKDVGAGRIARHRDSHNCDHALVVAPDFERGALTQECKDAKVTPMKAAGLARLLMLSAATGPLDLEEFRTVFELRDPDSVEEWVSRQESADQRSILSFDIFLDTLADIGFDGPDVLSASVIADRIRAKGDPQVRPTRQHIRDLVAGLSVLLPSIIRISGDDVFLSASPLRIREAVREQVGRLPDTLRFGLDRQVNRRAG